METGKLLRLHDGVRAVGWRVWTVQERPEGVRLGSVIHEGVWTPGRRRHALCSLGEHHVAPGTGCNCGFHAVRDPVDAFTYLHGRNDPRTIGRILGEVVLSGHVAETERGWRGSESYPLRLYVRDPELAGVLASYGVAVLSPGCRSATATSSDTGSAGSSTNSWSAARTRSSRTAASG
jgi:hypothetical protein